MSLKHLKNLGPVSARKLAAVGITSEAALRRLGAVEAYLRVKRTQTGISLNLLYALHGALTDTHWTRIGAEERAALLLEVDAREASSAGRLPETGKDVPKRQTKRGPGRAKRGLRH